MKNMYIISGPNGSGKTTTAYSIMPTILKCNEFVNADEIAHGLSPFNPESVAIQAGRLMLSRIYQLIEGEQDFAFETTLSTRSYVNLVRNAQNNGFLVTIIYFWLNSPDLAIERVNNRVSEGGHNIPEDIIRRRYFAGIRNLFNLYMPITDYWWLVDNSGEYSNILAQGSEERLNIFNKQLWNEIKNLNHEK
jgi:predicted ABC-type ATPase